jgi:hypothetical protein
LKNPSLANGYQYGVLPLKSSSDGDKIEFLIFGGNDKEYRLLDRTCVFKTCISNMNDSEFYMLESNQQKSSSMTKQEMIKSALRISPKWENEKA